MENLVGFYICVQFTTFVHPTQASTKCHPFVLKLSIVSVEVGELIFLENLIFLYLIILWLVMMPDYDGLV